MVIPKKIDFKKEFMRIDMLIQECKNKLSSSQKKMVDQLYQDRLKGEIRERKDDIICSDVEFIQNKKGQKICKYYDHHGKVGFCLMKNKASFFCEYTNKKTNNVYYY